MGIRNRNHSRAGNSELWLGAVYIRQIAPLQGMVDTGFSTFAGRTGCVHGRNCSLAALALRDDQNHLLKGEHE